MTVKSDTNALLLISPLIVWIEVSTQSQLHVHMICRSKERYHYIIL